MQSDQTSSKNKHQIEMHDLYKFVGHKGRSQIQTIVFICLVDIFLSFFINFKGFGFQSPEFRCPTPDNLG